MKGKWDRGNGNDDADQADKKCFLLVLNRTMTDDYSLALCNSSSEGANYHVIKPNQHTGGELLRSLSFQLHGVSAEIIKDTSFWFLVHRQMMGATEMYRLRGITSAIHLDTSTYP